MNSRGQPLPAHARGPVRVFRVPAPGAARWAPRIAAVTRAGYAGSDPLPGLPAPDGAADTAASVRRQLADGAQAWLAEDESGRLAGALRVAERPDATWEVYRVAVLPAAKGGGVARTMLDAVEAHAAAAGIRRVRVNAVIERCLPPMYANLGYRVTSHWPSPDKPLTEVTMEHDPAAARRVLAFPSGQAFATGPGLLVAWFVTAGMVLAVTDVASGGPGEVIAAAAARLCQSGWCDVALAGADIWPRAGRAQQLWLCRQWRQAAPGRPDGIVSWSGGRAAVRAHLMPRTMHPALLPLWRFAPGREASIACAHVRTGTAVEVLVP